MDTAEKNLIIEDTISDTDEHQLEWLLHSLSEPRAEEDKIIIIREGIKLTIEPMLGLLPEVQITNRFDVDLNAGIPEAREKAVAPAQFHMKWRTKKGKEHRIVVKFTVERGEIL